ncbi:hypothetical protein [Spirosoma sp. KNUC1025]|uniref:hypothetical protein n=1 Tax=Spirosoma sp. KNUC1025 TaxID=2894082 RepID=UPI003868F758|nr:hypothetical protein LN737_19230 [Spirosoma sp. KNUC1025]
MKIKILQACYGDTDGGFSFETGQEVDVSRKLGMNLISLGFAVEVKKSADPAPVK